MGRAARRPEAWGLPVFLGLEAALYAAFLALDLGAFPTAPVALSAGLKFAGICLCLFWALGEAILAGGADRRLLAGAMGFTVLADLFLLVLDVRYPLGVACFCCVQMLYFARLGRWRGGRGATLGVGLRLGLTALAAVLASGWHLLDGLTLLAAFSFINLACNCARAFRAARETGAGTRKGARAAAMPASRYTAGCPAPLWRFAAGLLLFVLCDLCVGLHNLSAYVPVEAPGLLAFARVGMWLFYLPSQVLIVCSGLPPEQEGDCP